MRGVEGVLANLLPVAIDLLARLLGLGNVSGRVQRIIADIRQSIEDAIVRLIQRVLARFTGRGRGGAGDGEDGPDGAPDEIMAPVRIRGGGESHTLTIDDQGETVVPMIRSTPMTLETWLDGRLGDPFTQLARDNGWEGTTRTEKYNALDTLVTQAKAEESQLDAKAEEAEDSVDEGNDTDATPAEVSEAQADVQAVAAQAQETKSALEQVLEFFGLTEVDLTHQFRDQIAEVPSGPLRDQFVANVIRRLDSRIYGTLTWAEAKQMMMGDGAIANAWKRPLVSDGIVQRIFEEGYKDRVTEIIHRSKPNVLDSDTNGTVLDEFLARNLSRLVNTDPIKRSVFEIMISSGASGAAVADALEPQISEAASRKFGQPTHDHAFNVVTGSFYKNNLVGNLAGEINNGSWGTYFHDDEENEAGSGSGVAKSIAFFLRADETGANGSKRAGKNRTRMADAVRGADRGQHEWIASRFAAAIVETAAQEVEAGNTDALVGASELLQFQHTVRTPTEKLVFDPSGEYPSTQVALTYKAHEHINSEEHSETLQADLSTELRNAWYPASGPNQGDQVGILQGHPGAVYARVKDRAYSSSIKPQSSGHSQWDRALAEAVTRDMTDSRVTFQEIAAIETSLVTFFETTIWTGSGRPQASGGRVFNT
ncbi:MAG: hypothetical protein AAGA78_08105, partial [Pseudomonadota bacterium]